MVFLQALLLLTSSESCASGQHSCSARRWWECELACLLAYATWRELLNFHCRFPHFALESCLQSLAGSQGSQLKGCYQLHIWHCGDKRYWPLFQLCCLYFPNLSWAIEKSGETAGINCRSGTTGWLLLQACFLAQISEAKGVAGHFELFFFFSCFLFCLNRWVLIEDYIWHDLKTFI